ncbi:cationic amino acid transporter 2-like [Gouania willdenowi]|uniref:cationic amino acid transporter 2-like n=1 Tax=Gouania willdenowi TaxID=441366 RepID=UPI0010559FEA|nr:cationic amino acid transporter 2-like [Gouania willdenowi]
MSFTNFAFFHDRAATWKTTTWPRVQRSIRTLSRKKPLEPEGENSNFCRCLTTLDLVGLGIASTLGAGIYIVTGEVAREVAGPSIIISFFVAAVASIFAGLCYAECAARIPKTGSAYLYCYVSVGEALAFVTGWNLILSYVIGTSSMAKAWTGVFDDLIDNVIAKTLTKYIPMNSPGLAQYPDFLAAGLIMMLAGTLAFGVKESTIVNIIFTAVNVIVLVFIIIAAFIKGDLHNWRIKEVSFLNTSQMLNDTLDHRMSDLGKGGFLPFGFDGTLAGSATCFYAFVGFNCIATTGEEVKNPQKAIPFGIVLSLLICFLACFGVSASLTLMMPYYQLDSHSPLPVAFEYVGWEPAKYVVAIGSLCALSTSLLAAMFPMARVLFAMARDGLLFKKLCYISVRHTPVVATLSSGAAAAVMVLLLDLKALVDMTSIGFIFAHTLVAVCILILRYKEDPGFEDTSEPFTVTGLLKPPSRPTKRTSKNVNVIIIIILFLVVILSVIMSEARSSLRRREVWSVLFVTILIVIFILAVILIWRQPQGTTKAAFMLLLKSPHRPTHPQGPSQTATPACVARKPEAVLWVPPKQGPPHAAPTGMQEHGPHHPPRKTPVRMGQASRPSPPVPKSTPRDREPPRVRPRAKPPGEHPPQPSPRTSHSQAGPHSRRQSKDSSPGPATNWTAQGQ